MRITRRLVWSEMHHLAKETGIDLHLEEYSHNRKNEFILHQTDESGAVIKMLTEGYYTTKEMYLVLKTAREICKTMTNIEELVKKP